MVGKTITGKKNIEIVKEELWNSLRKSDTAEEQEFNIQNIINQREDIDIMKHYEEIIKTGNKKTIRYETKQGQMLKTFKEKERLIENIELSKSTVHFKIGLCKRLRKFPALKNSSLSSHYFRNNFKLIKIVCNSNEELFL